VQRAGLVVGQAWACAVAPPLSAEGIEAAPVSLAARPDTGPAARRSPLTWDFGDR